MIVQKIIERYRRKGYDDFYLADFAEKYETSIFWFGSVLPMIISMFLAALMFHFWGITMMGAWFIISFICSFPMISYCTIIGQKQKGETELRMTYIFFSKTSKICLKAIRYAPVISAGLLVVCLIIAVILYGIHVKIIMAFVISLLLLLVIARPYHRLLSHVMMEALYYVDWKTHQIVEHFKERYSGYEKWRIPSYELDFEKFNTWNFRNLCQMAFVSTVMGWFGGLIYALAFSPMSCMDKSDKEETYMVRQSNNNSSIEKTSVIQTQVTSNEIKEVLVEEPIMPEVEETFIREEEEVEEQLTDEEEAEDIIEPQEEETVERNNNRTECFPLNLLDEMPTMSDGTALSRGVVAYLREQIPELEGKHAYVEFKISPEGEVVEVDASLVYDRELREKIKNSLYSMPNVNPGKKDGRTVYVRTNITVER